MITRKALVEKLEEMNKSAILVSLKDYRNSHPMAKTPLQKKLAELIGVQAVEARHYTTKRGVTHSSPTWLIEAYKQLATLIYGGYDINVRTLIASVK